ncbi:acyl carrier protein [Rhodopila sp.]|jgi:acyl carrier protein|uniref:acyl carrier protein n=1 Tax=Rhodopila sp. TaxID=2480087 RepID=UPI002B534F26|nr:acyl carrier protein [Rhodopila sp.]HVZ10043.1 acyl carrier protein [Rhodopila sp.]
MQETIETTLAKVIATQANVDPSLVVAEATLSDLGVTSLDLVEIIMTIEDEYDVTIPVNAVEAWNNYKTVADLVGLGRSLGLEGRNCGS